MTEIQISFSANKETAQSLATYLEDALFEEAIPVALFEIDGTDTWTVDIYFESDAPDSLHTRMQDLLKSAPEDARTVPYELIVLPETDWIAKGLESLKPIRAGRFYIHGSHDRDTLPDDAIGIEIDAGQAFGTGHHGTTAGCLTVLDTLITKNAYTRPLDLGTGTGILAIGLAKVLQASILATDIDPVSVDVAADNSKLNGTCEQTICITADGFDHPCFAEHGPFDLVVANILAGPLIALAPELVAVLAPTADVVLSGLLPEQAENVRTAYEAAGLTCTDQQEHNGWIVLTLTNKPV